MIEQLSLLEATAAKHKPLRSFTLTVRGRQVQADFQEDYCSPYIHYDKHGKVIGVFATHHIDFRTDSPGPISESGYRSHFFHGTLEELGITKDSLRRYIQEIAEWLADTYEKEAPERRKMAAFAKKNGWKYINGGYR